MEQPRVLVFGEGDSDREAIRELIVALCAAADGRVEKRMKPLLLVKNASAPNLSVRAQKLAATVRADQAARGPVACVFVHEDADDLAPTDERRAAAMREATLAAGLEVCPVVPAWELEAWWFLFPDAVASAFPSWSRLPSKPQRQVDRIRNAKEAFRNATTPRRARRRYTESDGIDIARAVRQLDLANRPVGRADAYDRFRQCVDQCCARLGEGAARRARRDISLRRRARGKARVGGDTTRASRLPSSGPT